MKTFAEKLAILEKTVRVDLRTFEATRAFDEIIECFRSLLQENIDPHVLRSLLWRVK